MLMTLLNNKVKLINIPLKRFIVKNNFKQEEKPSECLIGFKREEESISKVGLTKQENEVQIAKEIFDQEGYNRWGYDREGYNQKGYDKEGYDREGYNLMGYKMK